MKGLFITFEGTEGLRQEARRSSCWPNGCASWGTSSRMLREPGGTPIGEEIRHTLKHSKNNAR